jgi:HNH endonuclease
VQKHPTTTFFNHIKKTSHCWIWTGGLHGNGYGRCKLGEKRIYAHRASWIIHKGLIPKGLFVLHDCRPLPDNRACVNFDHLWLGTHKENLADMAAKGNSTRGEKSHLAKLKTPEVIEIRRLLNLHADRKMIMKKFNISYQTVCDLKARRSWSWLY